MIAITEIHRTPSFEVDDSVGPVGAVGMPGVGTAGWTFVFDRVTETSHRGSLGDVGGWPASVITVVPFGTSAWTSAVAVPEAVRTLEVAG